LPSFFVHQRPSPPIKTLARHFRGATRMPATTSNFNFLTAGILTRLAAILILGVATARHVCTLLAIRFIHNHLLKIIIRIFGLYLVAETKPKVA
jgi:hypothetical protein